VSSYPWGWAPYRYGSWNFAQASGWCWQPGAWNHWVSVPRFGKPPIGWKAPVPPADGRGRVPRIHGEPVAGGAGSRFDDPTRRVVREGLDGGIILPNQGARGEAGLGVPRSRVNLGNLPAPPTPGVRGFVDDRRGGGDRRTGGTSAPVSTPQNRSSAPTSAPRPSAPTSAPRPAAAPRMSPPPPSRPPSPAPRGGKGL
jgi:hypothetical protein